MILTATQGKNLPDILNAFEILVSLTAEMASRYIIRVDYPSRPSLEGADNYVWYAIGSDVPDASPGPGSWGNQVTINLDVHFITRSLLGGAQKDQRRWNLHYVTRWRLYQAFQGNNLFDTYLQQPVLGQTDIWQPPQPDAAAVPLTYKPMLLAEIPMTHKTDQEEGSINTDFRVIIPSVLNLTLGEGIPAPP